jgi:hypothetical protein
MLNDVYEKSNTGELRNYRIDKTGLLFINNLSDRAENNTVISAVSLCFL